MKALRKALNSHVLMRWWFFIGLLEFTFYFIVLFRSDDIALRLFASFWFTWMVICFVRWQLLSKRNNLLDTLELDNCVDCGSEYTRLDDKPVCWNCGNNLTYNDVFKVAKEDHYPGDDILSSEMRHIWINRMYSNWSTWNKPKNKNHN